MKITREHWKQELLSVLLAPSFYVYVLGIIIVVLAQVLPEFLNANDITISAGDSMGFMAARYFASAMGSIILFLPAFVVASAAARDKEKRVRAGLELRAGLSAQEACLVRVASQLLLMFIPLLMAASIMLSSMADRTGGYHYMLICFTWLLPALFFEICLAAAATEWSRMTWPGIVLALVVWVFTQGSTANVGDYHLCVAVRHEVLGGFAEYSANAGALAANRLIVAALGVVFLIIATMGRSQTAKSI